LQKLQGLPRVSFKQDGGDSIPRTSDPAADAPVDSNYPHLIGGTTTSSCRFHDGPHGSLLVGPVELLVQHKGQELSYSLTGRSKRGWRQQKRPKVQLFLQPLSAQAAAALGDGTSKSSSISTDALAAALAALQVGADFSGREVVITAEDWLQCSELFKDDTRPVSAEVQLLVSILLGLGKVDSKEYSAAAASKQPQEAVAEHYTYMSDEGDFVAELLEDIKAAFDLAGF
jgi:hypothetical protein